MPTRKNSQLTIPIAAAFNQPLGEWNVGQVTGMRWMFYNAAAFNQPTLSCSAGRYYERDYFCSACIAGKASSVIDATSSATCDACAVGKYSSFTGATSSEYCIPCEEGKASKYEGANSIEFCEDIEEEISGAGSLFGISGCAAIFWVTVVSFVVYVW